MSVKERYTLVGILFGLCFPVVSVASVAFMESLGGGLLGWLAEAHARHPLLYVIDTAPLFLGLAARSAGLREERYRTLNDSLAAQVAERTALLEAALGQAQKANEQISHMADHDELTGLYSRRRFQRELEHAIAHARRYQRPLALLFIDLNEFKPINDRHGHDVGDLYLKAFADALDGLLRGTDRTGRWGGDEFLALLPEAGIEAARCSARRLLDHLAAHPFELKGLSIACHCSVGIAVYPDDAGDARELMERADQAMYRAKARGGGIADLAGQQAAAL